MSNSVTVVIPHYQTPTALTELLSQVTQTPVIVVNNSSEKLTIAAKNVAVVQLPFNTGFAHACNVGAVRATTPWVLFINPDLEVTDQVITQLIELAEQKQLDAASPRLMTVDGKTDWQYHQQLPSFWSIVTEFSPLKKLQSQHLAHTTLPGGCLLIKTKVLEELGYWDERFFIWWEDSDLSMRLQATKCTFSVLENLSIPHRGGESFKKLTETYKRQLFFHSLEIFARKHFNAIAHQLTAILTSRFFINKLYPADPKLRVSIVVPNIKQELLENFLSTNLRFINLDQDEVIIVTSATQIRKLRERYPQVIFIQIVQNHGFAHTVNIGIRRARGQQIITVNDDTILEKNWIPKLLEKTTSHTGTTSPCIVKNDGKIESMGVHILKTGKAEALTKLVAQNVRNGFNAAAVLLNRQALEVVGLFSESFGSYLEDLDLGLRMHKQGYKHTVSEEVTITHLGQQTSQNFPVRKAWQDFKNWWLLIMFNYSLEDYIAGNVGLLLERGRNFSGLLKAVWKSRK